MNGGESRCAASMSELVFLYGTLVPGHEPAEMTPVVTRLRRVGPARVKGRLYDFGAYPGAILDESSDSSISGRVFEVPDKDLLTALDDYEGFDPEDRAGSLFVRVKCPVTLADGRKLECWIYVYDGNPGGAPVVAGGDYARSNDPHPASEPPGRTVAAGGASSRGR